MAKISNPAAGNADAGPDVIRAMNRPVPSFALGRTATPQEAFATWRDTLAPLFDVALIENGSPAAFNATLQLYHLGPVIVGTMAAPAQAMRRGAPDGRSRTGHILIQAHQAGRWTGAADGRPFEAEPGDVSILDLSRPCVLFPSAFETKVVIAPREMFANYAAVRIEALHGLVVSGSTALGEMMREHILTLDRGATDITAHEADAIARGSIGLLAAYAGPSSGAAITAAGGAQMAPILRYIERHLEDPDLDVTALVKRFNLSRASLYRAFRPMGGVANHLMNRRLSRAFDRLTAPDLQDHKIRDFAFQLGFSSESAFSRAFRQTFGMSPRAARANAGIRPGAVSNRDPAKTAMLEQWITEMASPAVPAASPTPRQTMSSKTGGRPPLRP